MSDNENEKEGRNTSPLKALSGASRDIRKYTHQIWLAGLGAFARAEEEGSGFFDALVEAGGGVTGDRLVARFAQFFHQVLTGPLGRERGPWTMSPVFASCVTTGDMRCAGRRRLSSVSRPWIPRHGPVHPCFRREDYQP